MRSDQYRALPSPNCMSTFRLTGVHIFWPNMQKGPNKKIFSRTPETHDMPTWVNILTSPDFGQQNCSAQNKFNMYILNNMFSYQEQLRCTRQVRNKDNWNKNPSNTSKISFFWSYAQVQKRNANFTNVTLILSSTLSLLRRRFDSLWSLLHTIKQFLYIVECSLNIYSTISYYILLYSKTRLVSFFPK